MNEPQYTFHAQPAKAGCWIINKSLHIYVEKKPNWFHKKMVKLMFGWDWQNGEFGKAQEK